VAKLVERLVATAALWVRIQTSIKNTKWANLLLQLFISPKRRAYIFRGFFYIHITNYEKKTVSIAMNLARQKNIQKKNESEESGRREE
jgi:hypothetical protein